MAQRSRPQAGNRTTNPLYVDSGPYAGDRWATLFRVLFTGDQQATQGVLKGVWNELEPLHPIANREVVIDTGVGICNGHVFFNDTNAVTIGVDAGVARADTLVMLENNTNAAIAAGAATNYNTEGPDTAIPPYSCRLAVVKGVAITQTTALYMTPLATFTTGALTFTNFTDTRTFCRFSTEVGPEMIEDRTRRFFVQASRDTDATTNLPNTPGVALPDGSTAYAYGVGCVPDDYVSTMTAQVVLTSLSSGNVYGRNGCGYGGCGEGYSEHGAATAYAAEAILAWANNCNYDISLNLATAGDILGFRFERVGGFGSDTVNDTVYVRGWLVSYTADS